MSNTKEEILDKTHWDYVVEKGISSIHSETFPSAYKEQAMIAMEEYAKDQMTTLLRNMAGNPVSVFSQKVRGQEKQFFLGSKYVEDLIKRLNQ